MIWSTFFSDGGWGMYPTSLFGALLLGAAVLYAVRPDRRFVPLLVSLGVVAIASGVLGFSVGVITTFRYVAGIPAAQQHPVTLIGFAESANNIVIALVAIVLSGLIAAIGGLRIARTATHY